MFLGRIQTEYNTINFDGYIINKLKSMTFDDQNFGRLKINIYALKNAIEYINNINNNLKPSDENIKGLLICYAAILYNEDIIDKNNYLIENNYININNNLLYYNISNSISDYYITIDDIRYGINNLIIDLILNNNQFIFNNYYNDYIDYLINIKKKILLIIFNNSYLLVEKTNNNLYDFMIDDDYELYLNKLLSNNYLLINNYKIINDIYYTIILIESSINTFYKNNIYNLLRPFKFIKKEYLLELSNLIKEKKIINTNYYGIINNNIYINSDSLIINININIIIGMILSVKKLNF